MAVSNSLAAVMSGVKGLHVTVNGMGERCGNAPLASVQVILADQLHVKTNINENRLNEISRLVEGYSGISIAPNQPIVGENEFGQNVEGRSHADPGSNPLLGSGILGKSRVSLNLSFLVVSVSSHCLED